MAVDLEPFEGDMGRDPIGVVRAQRHPQRVAEQCRLIAEVPVAIVIQGTSVAVMMATPSDLKDFAIGFAYTEGFISSLQDVVDLEIVDHDQGIETRLWLKDDKADAFIKRRRSMAGPVGCGLCGIESLDQAVRQLPRVQAGPTALSTDQIKGATELLRRHQPLHDETHAAHGAGFVLPTKGIAAAREDVGRHNALDKLIGGLLRQGISPAQGAFILTSRVSVELVQKTAIAQCPILVAVSAPTTLAVETANATGITLIAQTRQNTFKTFSHKKRIHAAP